MRVGVAGRPGGFAAMAARDLLETPGIEAITLIDSNSPASDLKGCRVVAACWGDDPAADRECAERAIASGADYISTGYSTAVLEALLGLDDYAKQSGRSVVTCMSWSPGITNLMAALAKADLGGVEELDVCWVASAAGPYGASGISRVLAARSGRPLLYERGGWRQQSPGAGRRQVFFPEPVGYKQVSPCRSPEVLSLPRCMPEVARVQVSGGIAEPAAAALLWRLPDPDSPKAKSAVATVAQWLLSAGGRLRPNATTWSAARVKAGSGDAKSASVVYGIADQVSNLASASLLTAVRLLGETGLGAGVLAPEEAFDPKQFFAFLAQRGPRVARLQEAGEPRL